MKPRYQIFKSKTFTDQWHAGAALSEIAKLLGLSFGDAHRMAARLELPCRNYQGTPFNDCGIERVGLRPK